MARRTTTTLKDIAREVGVSTMAVSTVLHDKRNTVRVSEETRLRIKEVAQRLRYRPNVAARGLSQQRMNTIGIVAQLGGQDQDVYFMEVLNGILAGGVIAKQNTTILPIGHWNDEETLLGFCDGRVDGLVLIGSYTSQDIIRTLRENIPVVAVQSNAVHPGVPFLDVDNEAGGYLATRYLLSQGHRRILHLAAPPGVSGADLRHQGYCRAMREAGVEITPESVRRPEQPFFFSTSDGSRSMKSYLETTDSQDRHTAVFCVSDAIALGCIEAIKAHGLQVPEDISVVGFDDFIFAQIVSPPLTTIRQPFHEMGRRSVERLIHCIHSESDQAPHSEIGATDLPVLTEILPAELIVRQSVHPIP